MSYNLTDNANTYINTIDGNVDIKISEIVDIVNFSGTVYIEADNNDILCIDCDLGARVKIEEIRYYFSSTVASGTVLASIGFYYKNEEFENYSYLNASIGNGYYYTTVSGMSAPRFVRILHTVSGTSVSGTVVCFSIFNSDDEVDFGTDGTKTSESLSTSVYGGEDEIKSVAIYNDSNKIATAYITLEPQGTTVDNLLTISTFSNGPWIGIKENNQILGDYENGWSDGNLSDELEISNNKIVLKSNEQSGTYTTKIFDNVDSSKSFVHMEVESDLDSSFATKDADKEVRTIEIRSTTERPKDYAICRTFSYHTYGNDRYLYYVDRYRDTGEVVYTSPDLGTDSRHNIIPRYVVIDQNSEKTVGYIDRSHETGTDWRRLSMFTVSKTGSYSEYKIYYSYNGTDFSDSCYNLCLDVDGGTWASIYSAGAYATGGYVIQDPGYYLIHFTSSFSYSYRLYTTSRQPGDMDCVYDTGKLWYTNSVNNLVKLVTGNGTEEVQRSDPDSLYGICATSDGGCWYVSGVNLIRLDSDGVVVTTLENIGSSSLRRVVVDGDDALYIRDGEYIKRIFIDGTVDFSVYVSQADRLLQVTDTGVWVRTSGNKIRFVDKVCEELKSINISYSYYPGVMEYAYNVDEGHGFRFPISIDTHWQNLEWQEVRPSKFALPIGDEYYQARITLQPNNPSDVYDVPDTIWTPNDYFTQASGTAPREHRWVPSDNTNSIQVYNNNRLRFVGGVGGTKYIQSMNKWYIDSEGRDIDIQLYYRLPGVWNPPPAHVYLYIRLYGLDVGHTSHYFNALMMRLTDGTQRLYAQIYDGATNGFYSNWTATYNYGYIRIFIDRASDKLTVYDYINGQWVNRYLSSISSYPIGESFYVWIYTSDHGEDLDIDNFTFNSNVEDVKFYEWDSPILNGVYNQKSVELEDIYPNQSKDIYLKTSLPSQDLSYVGNYNSNLRAWWEVPTNV